VYDKERDDGTFTPQDPTSTPPSAAEGNGAAPLSQDALSHGEWDPTDTIFVTMPPWHPVTSGGGLGGPGRPDKEKAAKNPVSHWRVSRRNVFGEGSSLNGEESSLMVTDFVFSPDVKYVAAISEDGCLRVIDALAEQ